MSEEEAGRPNEREEAKRQTATVVSVDDEIVADALIPEKPVGVDEDEDDNDDDDAKTVAERAASAEVEEERRSGLIRRLFSGTVLPSGTVIWQVDGAEDCGDWE